MKLALLLILIFPLSLHAVPPPVSSYVVAFTADPVPTSPAESFPNFRIDQPEFGKILDTYFVVTKDQWWHGGYSHVAGNDRTGTATLRNGTLLKWLVRPGGLATITFPDGTTVYYAATVPQ